MGTGGGLSVWDKAAGGEVDYSHLTVAEIKNEGTIPASRHTSSWRGA